MDLLIINTGSSSIKLAVYNNTPSLQEVVSVSYPITQYTPANALSDFLQKHALSTPSAIAHRIVHGGQYQRAHLINHEVREHISEMTPLAPLHNPKALEYIAACDQMFGLQIPQVAVFDTAFFSDLPEVARRYALPLQLTEKYPIQRYGFHGLAHQTMVRQWRQRQPKQANKHRLITLQLGSGCSITAVRNGKPVDTSMGFSPLEGLVMATRCGDLDPGVVLYLQNHAQLGSEQLHRLLNQQSGLAGISGISGDMQTLIDSDDANAKLAIDLFCYRVQKYIGAYLNVLAGADAIILGGGIGENAPLIRKKIFSAMQWCDIELDETLNDNTMNQQACISTANSSSQIWTIPVNEALQIATESFELLKTVDHP